MIRLNTDKLVRTLVSGVVRPPVFPDNWKITYEGKPFMYHGCGGITYNVRVGDSAYGWAADHVEPGASTSNLEDKEMMPYYLFCCMGNRAEVISGKAEGAVGYVVAKHAGINHVVCDFAEEDLKKMRLRDAVQVEVYGMGLSAPDYPDVHFTSIDPGCLEALGIGELEGGRLRVPVAGVVPAELMGSGLGSSRPMGDVDYMAHDWDKITECRLENIRLGDLVMVKDMDASYGLVYKKGAASVGVIVHGDSPLSGHGPGVTFFMSTAKDILVPEISKDANIGLLHEKAYGPLKPMPEKPKDKE